MSHHYIAAKMIPNICSTITVFAEQMILKTQAKRIKEEDNCMAPK